jgi:hypothetical protein
MRPTRMAARNLRIGAAATAALAATALAMSGYTASAAGAPETHYGAKALHPTAATSTAPRATGADTLTLQTSNATGSVSPNPKVYLVFWGSQWSKDPAGVAPDLQGLFNGLYGSADTWGTVMNQYCENAPKGISTCPAGATFVQHPTSSPLAGVWFDNAAAEPSKASTKALAAEAAKAATHFGNKTQASNLDSQYVIVSATGTHPNGFPNTGFCAWHDKASTASGTLSYTNLPYIPDLGAGACTTFTDGRLLSGIESTETHEYAESVTDFWPTAGWYNTSGGEIGDECENLDAYVTLTTGRYDLQGLWSNSANACVTHG